MTKRRPDEPPKAATDEAWISVDVEASGPTPGTGSLIALGACLVDQPEVQFESTIAPIPGLPWSEEAERVHGLTREHLAILQALRVPRGFTVLTKADLVEPEWLELAIADVRGALARTFLAGRYDHAIGKARSWIGYQPQGDLRAMMRSADAFRRGEHDGYDWTGIS